MVSSFLAGLAFVAGAFTGACGVMYFVRRVAESDREVSGERHKELIEIHRERNEIFDDILTATKAIAKSFGDKEIPK